MEQFTRQELFTLQLALQARLDAWKSPDPNNRYRAELTTLLDKVKFLHKLAHE
jgi:hypothetical protein